MSLSQDELFEVFSWFPSKTIHRFKSVTKSCSNFSDEPYFALKQAQNMLMKDDTCLFIQLDSVQSFNEQIELHSLPEEHLSSGVSNDVLTFLANRTKVLDSSNGLVLCRTTYKNPIELFVCNPSTQCWLNIPMPEHFQENRDLKIMLQCSPRSHDDIDDYKVIFFEDPIDWDFSSNYVCNVYNPKVGAWKRMEKSFFTGSRSMRFNMPVHYNGSLHFISDCFPSYSKKSPYFRPYIMSYNLDNCMSRMLKLPKEARRDSHDLSCEMRIFNSGKTSSIVSQSICLVRLKKSVFTIWVLRDYESSSWYKVLKVRVKGMGLKEEDPKVTQFIVMNGDSLIFAIDKKVYSYGFSDENYMILEEVCEHRFNESIVWFTPYSNTLRPCGTGATTLPCKGSYTISNPSEEKCYGGVPFESDFSD